MLLAENQLIEIFITGLKSTDGDLIGDLPYSFSTTFNPLYSTPNKVRAIAGSYVKDISDEMLIYLIHTYSIEAQRLSQCLTEANEQTWTYYASLWVTYSAALNAVYNSKIYVGESGQKIYKKLGDFSISKDNTNSDANPAKNLIDKLECEIYKLSVAIRYCREPLVDCTKNSADTYNPSAAQLVTKGEALPRPTFGRTFYSHGRHPQWTGIIKQYGRQFFTNIEPYIPNPEPSNSNYIKK